MSNADQDIYSLSHSQVWSGFRRPLPISCFVVIFGAAFGLAATQAGLDNRSTMLMSIADYLQRMTERDE